MAIDLHHLNIINDMRAIAAVGIPRNAAVWDTYRQYQRTPSYRLAQWAFRNLPPEAFRIAASAPVQALLAAAEAAKAAEQDDAPGSD